MNSIIVRRCLVSGRVQGVFYRASTRSKAMELRLNGYARNLADGRVEVLLAGESPAVEAMIEWLHLGPPAARVEQVEVTPLDADATQVAAGFVVA